MTAISSFIDQGWNDHVDDLPGVTARLNDGFALLEESPADLNGLLQLAEHVHIVHRGDAQAMQLVIERAAALLARQADARPTVDKARVSMALLRGEPVDASALPLPALVRAHGSAVCGLAARDEVGKARRLLQATASLARDADANERTDAIKALAASYNNLASLLLDIPRSAEAGQLMLDAAAHARSTWAEVGTWLNVERADYMLSICHAGVGHGARAVEHAQSCLAVCEANAADAFERFFAHEAMARALLADHNKPAALLESQQMQELLPQIADEGNRAYASSVLSKLQKQESQHP